MRNLPLFALAATALWLLAPADEAHAQEFSDVGYVCSVSFDVTDGTGSFRLYSAPSCGGNELRTFVIGGSDAGTRGRLANMLTTAAAMNARVSIHSRRTLGGGGWQLYTYIAERVTVRAD